MARISLSVILAMAVASPAMGEIEKIAIPCETGFCFYWWPKLAVVDGWHHDRDHSLHYGFNAQAPDGENFASAETVIYANAPYKPRMPEVDSLDTLIENDQEKFRNDFPGVEIREVTAITTGDGRKFRSFSYSPAEKGSWERVSYGEEGDFFLIFTVSSRTKEGLEGSAGVYEAFVQAYKENP